LTPPTGDRVLEYWRRYTQDHPEGKAPEYCNCCSITLIGD
jgi:hypothetical protein